MRQIRYLTLAVLLVTGAAACGGGPTADQAEHLKRGDQYLAENKLPEAIVEYKVAVGANPNSGAARLKLAEAYEAAGDTRNAAREYVQAADRLPDDLATQVKTARILIAVGRFEDARGRTQKVLAKDPNNVEAIILEGNALAGLQDLAGAVAQVELALRLSPSHSTGYATLGTLQMARGNAAEAEAAFKRAVATAPQLVGPKLALANFYWSSNRRSQGEALLHEALKLEPKNLVANKALYLMFLGSKRIAEAEAPLKVIAENSPDASGRIALADYYAASRRFAEARQIYEDVARDSQFGSTAKLRLASLGLIAGDRAAAYRLVDEVLKREPRNVEALVGKAQLQLGDGKLAEALVTARAATTANPNHAPAHYMLGLILAADRQTDEATQAFQDALRVGIGFAPANYELARLSLAAGKFRDAVQYARAALQIIPGYGEAHLVLARAEMLNGNAGGAEESVRLLAANFPDQPTVQAQLGRLLLMKDDLAGARRAFERALSKDGAQPEALEGITVLDLRQGRSAAARARLDAAVAAGPNNAMLQLAAAHLYSTAFKDEAAAERAARRALTIDPNNLEAFGTLARLHAQANNLPAATAEFEKLAERQPKSVANQTAVGMLLHLQNRLDDAKARYERALAIDPHSSVAANNLAQLYADRNENLDVALQLAQTAKAGLPNAHQVDDTLGWIYYKKGIGELAVASLKRAVAAQPDNVVYLYHLGAAHALANDKVNARLMLDKALRLQPNFAGADDARRILDSLKN